jgi:surface-anchored protein
MKFKKLISGILTTFATLSLVGNAWALDILSHHINVDIDYVGGNLTLDLKTYNPINPVGVGVSDDTSPAGHRMIVPLSNAYVVPATDTCLLAGSSAGTVYYLDKSPVASEVYLGWNTQDIGAVGVWVGNKVTLDLISVTLPPGAPAGAHVSLVEIDPFGSPLKHLDSGAGACRDMSMDISRNKHVHAFWYFSAPGQYTLRFQAKGTLVAGGVLKTSAMVDYVFNVM